MDYYPKNDNDFINVLSSMLNKIDGIGATSKMTDMQIAAIKANCLTVADKQLVLEYECPPLIQLQAKRNKD